MRRDLAQAQAIALIKAHGLWDKGWRFGWMSAKKTNGICYYNRKEIKLSSVFVEGNDEKRVGLTVLHEIAHALVGPGAGHGPVWRAKCLAIGGDGNRCGESAAVVEYAWHGVCGHCGIVLKQHRAPLRVKACGTCVNNFLPEAVFVWSKNGRRVALGAMPVRYVKEALILRGRYGDRLPV